MLSIKIRSSGKLSRLDFAEIKKIWLFNASEEMIATAQENAPVLAGKLKQSIGREPANITGATNTVRVWPRKVIYAVVREFNNSKNPHKKFYMKRTFDVAPNIIKKAFTKAAKIVLKNI